MTPAIASQVGSLTASEGMPEGLNVQGRDKIAIMDVDTDKPPAIDDDDNASDSSHAPSDDESKATEMTTDLTDNEMDVDDTPQTIDMNNDEDHNSLNPANDAHSEDAGKTQECKNS